MTMDEIASALLGGAPLPERAVGITFDDGYLDLFRHALPALDRVGFRATFFIIAGKTGNEHGEFVETGFAPERLLSWSEVRKMREAGMTIGSHALTHTPLDQLSLEAAKSEIVQSKKIIEEGLGSAVRHFCYPKGRWTEAIAAAVREAGYETACATKGGKSLQRENIFCLRRIPIGANDTLWDFGRKVLLHPFRSS